MPLPAISLVFVVEMNSTASSGDVLPLRAGIGKHLVSVSPTWRYFRRSRDGVLSTRDNLYSSGVTSV